MVLVAASIAFLLLKLAGGDQFSAQLLNPESSADYVERMRRQFGYDQPLLVQYGYWLTDLLRGNLQTAMSHGGAPVLTVIFERLPATLLLMSLAFVASITGGVVLGAWQGSHHNSTGDRVASGLTLGIISMPDFWVAMLLIILFSVKLQWLPPVGMADAIPPSTVPGMLWDRIRHLIMPLLALTLVDGAVFARYQRAAMRDVINQHFIRSARAKGVPEAQVTRRHALRVAIIPVITIAGLFFPALLVGAVLIEQVFSWPGMGKLLVDAIAARDFSLVSGIIVVASAMTALGSFLADVAREVADPRLRA